MSQQDDLRTRMKRFVEMEKESPFTHRELELVQMAAVVNTECGTEWDEELSDSDGREWWGEDVAQFVERHIQEKS